MSWFEGKNSLKKALNVKYATDDTIKFILNNLMSHNLFQSKLMLHKELQQLNTSLEKQSKRGDSDFWTALAIQAKQGLFQEMGAFKGLVKALAVWTERKAAAKYLRENFAGHSIRNMREQQRIGGGQIEDRIVMSNFERVAGYIKNLGYKGPLALASNLTVCVKSLRSHNGHLVGAQGGNVPFSNLEELSHLVKNLTLKDKLCSKP
ncbi:hypothetical protein PCANC_13167 [Puccinia coronata f. sp. avenae]|uniref:Uncharacterized protein n=1 Tax=Puccinia coronata f. sp. avenae TaxID=200324 RepID=A0A2N5UVB7_9BASI|nr:hypothetical protein PCANC_13167 [Puccinia coronata f. sp. avenae]